MKKVLIVLLACSLSSCATILGGKITDHQLTKPKAGEKQREIRLNYLVLDLMVCLPCTLVDFATGAIYKKEVNPKE